MGFGSLSVGVTLWEISSAEFGSTLGHVVAFGSDGKPFHLDFRDSKGRVFGVMERSHWAGLDWFGLPAGNGKGTTNGNLELGKGCRGCGKIEMWGTWLGSLGYFGERGCGVVVWWVGRHILARIVRLVVRHVFVLPLFETLRLADVLLRVLWGERWIYQGL